MHVLVDDITHRQYWVDDLDPWIVHFSGGLGIRWYGFAYLLAFIVAAWIFSRWARQGRLPISDDQVPTFITYCAIGVMIGGRLGYCFFYNAHEVFLHPMEIVAIWHGGMASHGGILGLVLAICIYAYQQNLDPRLFLDAAAVVGPLGIAFGRIANFINGELWGRPASVPWAVIFPDAPLVNGIDAPRHPSQLYAAVMEGLLVFLIAQWTYARTSKPGLTTAVVCIAYGVGRFIDEFWRQPDLGQPVYWTWMSKGQLLTIPVIAIGIAWTIHTYKQGAVPKG
ncbi:prolipoprotein diacylglyceryl transferase [Granulicella sp. dw_53]|uniref:prolipoprotein diacylglyceryl transferase n=1 Tax=Granulicella sp. dw_53 TaxID=2719792 RepID=UPI001BD4597A|nr:prolipoprotein diacylglyceryl transferase [Granulicella sp. dw_53]